MMSYEAEKKYRYVSAVAGEQKVFHSGGRNSIFFVFFQDGKIESYIEQGTNKSWAEGVGAMERANLSICSFLMQRYTANNFRFCKKPSLFSVVDNQTPPPIFPSIF